MINDKAEMAEYQRKWYQKNKAKVLATSRKRYVENREAILVGCRKYRQNNKLKVKKIMAANYAKNRERLRLEHREYYESHKDEAKARSAANFVNNRCAYYARWAAYNAAKLNATPAWVDHAALVAVYTEASAQNLTVDHIVPLKHKRVCGLHVPWNLQLLTRSENSRKHNTFLCG